MRWFGPTNMLLFSLSDVYLQQLTNDINTNTFTKCFVILGQHEPITLSK